MVAKITTPKSIKALLNYNEKKVQKDNAQCLYAANFLNEARNMNFYQKLNRFEKLNELNERASTKTLHVSLNFSPLENFSNDKLIKIASEYMDKIGFGVQPFLIYKHEDAGHPHVHIVSTTIKENGSRINTHNIGRNQSEKARKEIEIQYDLIKAEYQQQILKPSIKVLDPVIATYGKSETKRSISNVVRNIFYQYKFTSLPEFNAALKQFNVIADRGKEEGRIFKSRGLVYRILDAEGNKVGIPIKASTISCNPILDNLEKKFVVNEFGKQQLKQATTKVIDQCLQSQPAGMKNLLEILQQKQIYTVFRQNTQRRLYGITFVDNQNKVVFNGSALGKSYSLGALQSKFSETDKNLPDQDLSIINKSFEPFHQQTSSTNEKERMIVKTLRTDGLIDILLSAKEQYDNTPRGLLKKKKKKKKKPNDL